MKVKVSQTHIKTRLKDKTIKLNPVYNLKNLDTGKRITMISIKGRGDIDFAFADNVDRDVFYKRVRRESN